MSKKPRKPRKIVEDSMWGKVLSSRSPREDLSWNRKFLFHELAKAQRPKFSERVKRKAGSKLNKLKQMFSKNKAQAFEQETRRLKQRIRVTQKQRQKAKERLEQLNASQQSVGRLDNIAKALTEIGKKNPFAGEEVFLLNRKWLITRTKIDPSAFMTGVTQVPAYNLILEGRSGSIKTNAVVYFDRQAFEQTKQWGINEWGKISLTNQNPILAVQIMHWDPKILAQFTKGMLKKRPKNPIAVIDLYGNVFFP